MYQQFDKGICKTLKSRLTSVFCKFFLEIVDTFKIGPKTCRNLKKFYFFYWWSSEKAEEFWIKLSQTYVLNSLLYLLNLPLNDKYRRPCLTVLIDCKLFDSFIYFF